MDLAGNVGVELYVKLKLAVRLDGLGDGDLALVNDQLVVLFQRLGDVLGGNGTVESSISTALAIARR